ncbi:MAG: glycosyltransferase family 4 protein [Fuerstiella sp.]|nr:glycosyltransferase family 4 protein [Fuerstiella sp.]
MPNTPERILLMAADLSFRGSSILALRMARGLLDLDIDTVMLCTRMGPIDRSLLKHLQIHELPGYRLPVWSRIVRRSVLQNLIDQPPDVIHVLTPEMLPQAVWLAERLSCPVVMSVNDHADASALQLPSSSRRCRMIVCVSDSVRASLPRHRQLNQIEQRVIHPGVPVLQDSECLPILEPDRAPVIGMAGPLEVLKGGSFFLRACHRVLSEGTEIRIVVAGSGAEERNLRKLATSLQLDDQITFVEESTDMKTFLSAMDVFCLPSLQQGIGVLLLEAMALGRPVIASGVGGIHAVLNNNQAGMTVPASDSRQLADAISRLIKDPDQTRKMAQAGRSLAAKRFSLRQMLDEVTALYAELCSGLSETVRLPQPASTSDRNRI